MHGFAETILATFADVAIKRIIIIFMANPFSFCQGIFFKREMASATILDFVTRVVAKK